MGSRGRYDGYEKYLPLDRAPALDDARGKIGRDAPGEGHIRRNEQNTTPDTGLSSAGSGRYRLHQSPSPPPPSFRDFPTSHCRRDDVQAVESPHPSSTDVSCPPTQERDGGSATSPPRLHTSQQRSPATPDPPIRDHPRSGSPLLPSLCSPRLPRVLTRRPAPTQAYAAAPQVTYSNRRPSPSARTRDLYDHLQLGDLGIARFGKAERSTESLPLPSIQEAHRAPDLRENVKLPHARTPIASLGQPRERERMMSLPTPVLAGESAMSGGSVIKGGKAVTWRGVKKLDIGQGDNGRWYCLEPGCGKSCSGLGNVRAHQRKMHFDGTPFHCTVDDSCTAKFANSEELKQHLRSHKVPGRFQCSCGIPYKHKVHLEDHLKSSKNPECRPVL